MHVAIACTRFLVPAPDEPGQDGSESASGSLPARRGGRDTCTSGEVMKKAYEAPTLVRLGTFRKKTGLLGRSGNDRLILSKN
ncbi:hypothetical protein SAV14893_052650 [Streptomyces avermitilis]|nr:hypothetical protein SAVMC3_65020 [Streptomyces avermitilis]GDY65872.1 hypothetical protein SAV14893_052650 [Streptomyces avermitilis]GDY73904.1 hypothetical protein SAV31267_033890 [Streptomyces avermitilis]GDY82983.1 hypothetical protein SAVCW2_21820 [Streptomyces avermitilis]